MKCPRCKKQLRKGAKFCPACGTRVEKKRGIRFTSILLVIAMLLGIVAVGWFGGILFAKLFDGKFIDLFSGKENIETNNVREVIAQAEEALAHAKKLEIDSEYENDITELYLQSVTNKIVELDADNGIATVEVSIPDLTELLPQTVTNALRENEETAYEELLRIIQTEVEKAISNQDIEKITTTVVLPVEEINGEYKPVYNEQWEEIVFGSLEDMYIDYFHTMIGGLSDEIAK